MIQKANKNPEYLEGIQDWVVEHYCPEDDKNPNHCQFSAAEVADIITAYQKAKLSGELKKHNSNKTCKNCREVGSYPKCYKSGGIACDDWLPYPKKK